jgi:2-oxo-3-hexenedioate decarboxylase
MPDLDVLAARLAGAAQRAEATPQLTGTDRLTLAEAYAVQKRVVSLRPSARIGMKLGFTSRAKMAQMGVLDLICGELTADMRIMDGGGIRFADFVHPRAEPEIAFLLKAPLSGRMSPAEALSAVDSIAVAVEVIDSRYQDFKFSLHDVVADNSSSAAFALGPWRSPARALDNLGLVLFFDGRPVQVGSSAAILGDPSRALAEAARFASDLGIALGAGSIVLAGAATAAEALRLGTTVTAEAAGLGRVMFTVGET